jgi:two-component system, chemotaxis family, protein-glutamate methylesterase/glutaminase
VDTREVKVLIVDDSAVQRMLLVQIVNSGPGIRVVGALDHGRAALDYLEIGHELPDVVVMDIHMPNMDGFETTRHIMETRPVPIIICTATADPREMAITFRSMEAGAVACVEKPVALGPDFDTRRTHLLETVRLMSEVRVVRRWNKQRLVHTPAQPTAQHQANHTIVGIGASTGGPPVLQTILSKLPKDFPAPILVVQHIAPGFLPGMVEWLNQTTGLCVKLAAHNSHALPGHVYVAPDDLHLGVGPRGYMKLSRESAENGLRPAVSHLFRSLATYVGAHGVGVLLTGMGKDGAAELKLMRDTGAMTIAQDRESSIVHGMPGEAIELGAAVQVLPADKIADCLITHMTRARSHVGEKE